MARRQGIAVFVIVIQSVLFAAHFFLYQTWAFSSTPGRTHGALWLKLLLGVLSASFVAASLLAFRYTNGPLRAFYRAASVWLGLSSFVFVAAILSWLVFGVSRVVGIALN